MTDTSSSAHNKSCSPDGHDQHLCFLMYEGFHLSQPEKYKELISDPGYRCQNCGRTAKAEANLCDPVKL